MTRHSTIRVPAAITSAVASGYATDITTDKTVSRVFLAKRLPGVLGRLEISFDEDGSVTLRRIFRGAKPPGDVKYIDQKPARLAGNLIGYFLKHNEAAPKKAAPKKAAPKKAAPKKAAPKKARSR